MFRNDRQGLLKSPPKDSKKQHHVMFQQADLSPNSSSAEVVDYGAAEAQNAAAPQVEDPRNAFKSEPSINQQNLGVYTDHSPTP